MKTQLVLSKVPFDQQESPDQPTNGEPTAGQEEFPTLRPPASGDRLREPSPSMLDEALAYAKKGWPVFPLVPGDKQPLISTKRGGRGFHDATTDADQIRAWWTAHPNANIAVATGQVSGLVSVDVDGPKGEARLREILGGELPATLINDTSRGRYQLIFQCPEGGFPSLVGQLGDELDTKGDGGYIAVAPSLHPLGARYRWRNPDVQPLPVPSALHTAVRASNGSNREVRSAIPEKIPVGTRDDSLFRLACSLLSKGVTPEATLAALLAVNAKQCEVPLDQAQVEAKVESAMKYASARDLPAVNIPAWPDSPGPEAYYGLAGDIVRAIEPHSEADRVALLVQLLVGFGNAVGRSPYYLVEADEHHLNLFALLVGTTSKGRKGTSWSHVRRLLEQADSGWAERGVSGLSSGEGLIWAVRDVVEQQQPVKKGGRVIDYQMVVTDPGVSDKRLLVVEPEFASVLRVIEREGNNLSPVVRQAWDSGRLRTLTKNAPAQATDAHISIIAHVTGQEVRAKLSRIELGNGFMNRFLIICVQRSKMLPDGGQFDEVDTWPFVDRLRSALAFGRGVPGMADLGLTVSAMERDNEARDLWHDVYAELSDAKPGLLGAVTSRAEAQVTRLACVYALLDESGIVRRVHLEAALAVWKYAAASAHFVFGETLGDPVADEVLAHLHGNPEGATRTALQDLFQRHKSAYLQRASASLVEQDLAYFEKGSTRGRPEERWFAKEATNAIQGSADSGGGAPLSQFPDGGVGPSECAPEKSCAITTVERRSEDGAKLRYPPPFVAQTPDKSQAVRSEGEAVIQQWADDDQ